jgi:acyl-CoA synthetase (AMP-forming)/AMP-acid ligase II
MFHASGLTAWALQLAVGGSCVILPGFGPLAVLEAIARHRITSAVLVPTMVQLLLDHPAFGTHDLSSRRSLLYAASPMSHALLDRVLRACRRPPSRRHTA